MHNERWLEALPEDGPESYEGGSWGCSGRRRAPSPQIDIQFQAHLSELQATAERLARGHGLRLLGSMGIEELRLRHPDFEFFHSRG
jgi:hypothetical protein